MPLNNHLKDFSSKPSIYWPYLLAFILNIFLWIILIYRIPPTTSWIPLHYNVYFGIDWLGPWMYIFIYPIIGLLILLFNGILGIMLQTKEPFLSKQLIWTGLLAQLFIIFSLLALIINYYN